MLNLPWSYAAKHSLRSLGRMCKIIFVPGNHDLFSENTENAWVLYDQFLNQFYGENMPNYYDPVLHMVQYKDPDRKILILGFNSYQYDDSEDCREP